MWKEAIKGTVWPVPDLKARSGSKVYFHSGEWSISLSGRFTPGKGWAAQLV